MVRIVGTFLSLLEIITVAALVGVSPLTQSWFNESTSEFGFGLLRWENNRTRLNRAIDGSTTTQKPRLVKDFDAFKSRYKKTYKRQFREYRSKLAFESNKNLVLEQEKNFKEGKSSFRCATNVLSDLSQTEYWMRYVRMTSNYFNTLLDGDHLVSAPLVNSADIPKELDWRESGFVTPPDNQKSCGSCYAFSIVRSIEGEQWH